MRERVSECFANLNARYRVPCRKTVKHHLTSLYEHEKQKLVDKFDKNHVALTSDLWTSNSLQNYITLTGHFIDPNWDLCAHVLGTRLVVERHTGSNIAKEVTKLTREFNVEAVPAITTDKASNMSLAARELNFFQVGCFAHTLQLAIEDGLKVPQISKTLGAARKLVGHFSHSALATNCLLSKQIDLLKLKLIQDVPTRWNSSFFTMERLLKLRVPVYSVIFDDSVTKPSDRCILDIRGSFWKVMEDVCPILEPLAEVTELLGKEDLPTGSSVYVLMHNLVSAVLKPSPNDSEVAKLLKVKIKNGLVKRFKVDDNGVPDDHIVACPLMIATFLDPRYKSLVGRTILHSEKKAVLQSEILKLMEGVEVSSCRLDTNANDPEKKRPKLWKVLRGYLSTQEVGATGVSDQSDLRYYLEESVSMSNPLAWWKLHQVKFPKLAILAKRYLSIPATSIPSERCFSTAGLTITKLRSNLEPDTVDLIIFLNRNIKSRKHTIEEKNENQVSCEANQRSGQSDDEGPIDSDLDNFLACAVATQVKEEQME